MIIDNTNLNVSTRAEIIKTVRKISRQYFVRIVYMTTSVERSMHNNYYRYFKHHMQNRKLVPDFVYKMMIKKFEIPTKKEKVDLIESVKPTAPIDTDYYLRYY